MKNKNVIYIITAVLILGLFFVGAKIYQDSRAKEFSFLAKEKSELFVRDHSPRFGSEKARVYLVEFLDPECESCRAFYPELKNLLEEFGDKVQLIIRYAPFHGNSKIAIRAIEAARIQGKYWEALEILFYYQPHWGDHHHPRPELIFEYLSKIGLDMEKLRADMSLDKITKIIEQDSKDLEALNVRRTPTFFANGKRLENFGIQYLRDLLNEQVKLVY